MICKTLIIAMVLNLLISNIKYIESKLIDRLLLDNNFVDIDPDVDYSVQNIPLINKRFDYGESSSSQSSESSGINKKFDPWPGRWLPDKVTDKIETQHKIVSKRLNDSLHDASLLKMAGDINPYCDDGKTNLTVDWTGTGDDFLCFKGGYLIPNPSLPVQIKHDFIPTAYHARHICMDKKITYDSDIPTVGSHRPAWARYGEYMYLPVQRWLHNLEHGAIVMLYHPCAHPLLVNKLSNIVKSCLYRHIITPYKLLPKERPLALVSWGWSMTMSDVNEHNVENFIKEHALHGFENISRDGDYDFMLKEPAEIVTTVDDKTLCPNSVEMQNMK